MVQAWYMDNEESDQRLEHHTEPKQLIQLEDLFKKTGVEYFKISDRHQLDQLKKERGYTYEDELICSKDCLENYEEKLKMFYKEHLHADEEIRYVLEGSGYFDVRDSNDQWVRIEVTAGDLIVLPGGIYHRFTLDTKNYLKAKRFFIGEPVWKAYNRPADEMDCRKEYVDKLNQGFAIAAN